MCGIAAVFLQPQERKKSEWAAIRELFTRNLISNEERGNEATGCAVVRQDGLVRLLKMPIAASRFVATLEYRSLLASLDPTTTLLLGHTRLPTRGDPALSANNHPLKAGPVFGVHNGQIDNSDELFARHRLPRRGSVDSEIIFRLLATVPPQKNGSEYLMAVRPLIRLLEGQFTFLACDTQFPDRLLVLKHNNPLFAHYQCDWRALVFSSRYIFLRKAFGSHRFAEAFPPDQLLLFEAPHLREAGFHPAASLTLYAEEKSNDR